MTLGFDTLWYAGEYLIDRIAKLPTANSFRGGHEHTTGVYTIEIWSTGNCTTFNHQPYKTGCKHDYVEVSDMQTVHCSLHDIPLSGTNVAVPKHKVRRWTT